MNKAIFPLHLVHGILSAGFSATLYRFSSPFFQDDTSFAKTMKFNTSIDDIKNFVFNTSYHIFSKINIVSIDNNNYFIKLFLHFLLGEIAQPSLDIFEVSVDIRCGIV